jgi:hypothetical protein
MIQLIFQHMWNLGQLGEDKWGMPRVARCMLQSVGAVTRMSVKVPAKVPEVSDASRFWDSLGLGQVVFPCTVTRSHCVFSAGELALLSGQLQALGTTIGAVTDPMITLALRSARGASPT